MVRITHSPSGVETTPAGAIANSGRESSGPFSAMAADSKKLAGPRDIPSVAESWRLCCLAMAFIAAGSDPLSFADRVVNAVEWLGKVDMLGEIGQQPSDQ